VTRIPAQVETLPRPVLSVPKLLRLRLARDPVWASWIGSLIVRAIGAWQRQGSRFLVGARTQVT
jgi:hypothetical protein